MSRHRKSEIPPIEEMSRSMRDYYRDKIRTEEEGKKRRAEVKREFEEFLKEESAKYPLGFNPWQE